MKAIAWLKARRVAVLMGGTSEEREISLRTGKAVLAAFHELGVRAIPIDARRNVAAALKRHRIGFCFIALHGRGGEDGAMQGLCEVMQIPYSGSGILASALSMDKAASKIVFERHNILTAPFIELRSDRLPRRPKFALPAVVKPLDGGSAIGVTIVREPADWKSALQTAAKISRRILVERYIRGKEVTAPVLGDRALPLIEIIPKGVFYDYRSKYVKGMSDHIVPARLSKKAEERVREAALKAHRALGCRALSRTDFIVDGRGHPWALELNSIPGMTETSLFPESARHAGISFPQLILEIVRLSVSGI